jgi:tetratricopeptide (TPR) repeat protein
VMDALAQAHAAREANRTADAIRLYKQVVRTAPASTEAWWYLGLLQYDLGKSLDAIQAFSKVTEQQPKRGAGWAMLGLAQYQRQDYRGALESLRRAQAFGVPPLNNLDKVSRFHLATLLNRFGEYDLSSGLLMSFVSGDAVTPQVQQAAGIAALRLAVLPEELAADDKEPVAIAGEAAVLVWQKRIAEAKSKAIELLTKDASRPNANYLMGYVLLIANDDSCLDYFKKELERDPAHVPARLQIAYELLRRGDAAASLPYAAEAAKREPRNFVARDIYGRILLDLNRTKEAISELEIAVKLAPGSPEAHLHLASAYMRASRKMEAARHRDIFTKLEAERSGKK